MNDVLYHWPESAAFGRAVPKSKIYEHGNVRAALRQRFVDDIQRVTWAYKLAESTIRLTSTEGVPEIQVFVVDTKGGDVSDDVLAAIDKSVHFPIVFEIARGDEVRTVAAQKTLGGRAPKIGNYLSSGWLPHDVERQPLPAAVDMAALFEALLASLIPVATRRGESVSEATTRMDEARKLEREIAALERKLRNEPQFNRKVELRKVLKERQAVLSTLVEAP